MQRTELKHVLFTLLLFVTPALAAERADSTSIVTTPNFQSPGNRYSASFRIEAFGPSVTNWSVYRPNIDKNLPNDPRAEVYSKNKFSLGYRLHETSSVGVGGETYYLSKGHFQFQDPYLFVRDTNLISIGDFRWDAALRAYAGVSGVAKYYHNPFGVRFNQDSVYRVAGGPTTLGFYSEFQYYVLSQANPGARRDYYFFCPYVDYRFNPKWSANFQVKEWTYNNVGRGFFTMTNDPVLLSPGVNWTPVKNFLVNPYLDFAAKRLAWNMTTIGLNLNWKAL